MKPIVEKSLRNCHTSGLDSIMFKEERDISIRMFVARASHDFWKNDPKAMQTFSIGLHPHHRDITIVPIHGQLYNIVLSDGPKAVRRDVSWYEYSSAIGGEGKFRKLFGNYNLGLELERIVYPRFMSAAEMHSVYVPKGEVAAWYVIGGKENAFHISGMYSNDLDLENFDFSKLYQPMSEVDVSEVLGNLGPESMYTVSA